jgi:hypothetical protein
MSTGFLSTVLWRAEAHIAPGAVAKTRREGTAI